MFSRRHRQYLGLALVIIVYVGGIIGWSWAVYSLNRAPDVPADTAAVHQELSDDARHVHIRSTVTR
jgi:uncharacterized oligopeptide transporter (OPT) family protein